MSKHNYTQYSNKKDDNVLQPAEPITDAVIETVVEEPAVEPVAEVVEEVVKPQPKIIKGVVVDCSKLNVRVAPNAKADIACIIDAKSEVKVNMTKSTDDWFSVCTAAGVEGFCMRQYIDANM